ncbi:MAG: hypothetical protein CSA70_02820 [Rhodobacterales bacterium]|nr:MAG: hypothetical protein CSA70_02820 [Rhodobacterales bacterium]
MVWEGFYPLSPAQERVLAEVSTGQRITIGDGELPETETPEVSVCAGILRLLLTACHIARGVVSLAGAHAVWLRDEPERSGASYPLRLGAPVTTFRAMPKTGLIKTDALTFADWVRIGG